MSLSLPSRMFFVAAIVYNKFSNITLNQFHNAHLEFYEVNELRSAQNLDEGGISKFKTENCVWELMNAGFIVPTRPSARHISNQTWDEVI
jgi:hypothetical protein